MRSIARRFSVNQFIDIINFAGWVLIATLRMNLSCVRSSNFTSGYLEKIDKDEVGASKRKKEEKLHNGSVFIGCHPSKLTILNSTDDGWNVFNPIWKEIVILLNKSNHVMWTFLIEIFEVKGFHPLINYFQDASSPADIIKRVKSCFEKSDNKNFKYESDLIANEKGTDLRVDKRDG